MDLKLRTKNMVYAKTWSQKPGIRHTRDGGCEKECFINELIIKWSSTEGANKNIQQNGVGSQIHGKKIREKNI